MTPSPSDGRFAPSPTGTLHLGNLRTALLAWLFARSGGGRFVVRMEDLDTARVRPGVAAEQLADVAALGVEWDGEVVAQSERGALYEAALARLQEGGHVYECFCTRSDIRAAASAPHGPLPPYPGTCRNRSAQQRDRLREERNPALRLRGIGTVEFTDRLHGRVHAPVDDVVVRRNDGAIAYNLAVVADDDAQGVREVVRGDDLIDATPAQIALAHALGIVPPPSYAHVPLVLAPDGSRLAKRHGAVTLRDVDPATALAWMGASLGLGRADTATELLERFDPERIPREPTLWEPLAR